MRPEQLERSLRIVMARFEYIWGRPVTPMEFYQVVELIELADERMDMDMMMAEVLETMECLEDTGQEYLHAVELSDQLHALMSEH